MEKKESKNILKTFGFIFFIVIFSICVLTLMNKYKLVPKEYYKASDFKIKTIYGTTDYDKDNIDDYTEFVLGARKDAENKPKYISKYYNNSYPPKNEGVCTDTIWRAFKEAGYSLRDMVDNDIMLYPQDYPDIKTRDINIDFRRVMNLKIFFSKYAQNKTLNPKKIEEWQPGDIVIFEDDHIGIISDRRNSDGITLVIHNGGQSSREEDYLTKSKITGHYRFDASKIGESILKPWKK
jgi:uncharacterized protein YijF (DUF1287 family)